MDKHERLSREIRTAKNAVRRAGSLASQLQADHDQELGRYELQAGEQLDPVEIVEFLYGALLPVREPANAAVQVRERIVITVSQPDRAQTKGAPNGQDVRRSPALS